jgi:hypothetical protein
MSSSLLVYAPRYPRFVAGSILSNSKRSLSRR